MEYPESQNSNWVQKNLYSWLKPFVWPSKSDQLPDQLENGCQKDVPIYYDSAQDYEAWRLIWQNLRHQHGSNTSEELLKESFIELFKHEYILAFIMHFIAIQLNVFTPFLLYYLFRAIFEINSQSIIFNVVIVISARFLRTLFNFIAENRLNMISQRIYNCSAQAVIDKATRSSLAAQKDQIVGTQISKLMHLDIQKLLQFATKKSYVVNYSISVLSNAFILIFLMGWAGFVGFLLLFINFAIFAAIFNCRKNDETQLGNRRDQRVRKSIQIFEMIKFIKISALQSYFYDKLLRLRDFELQYLRKTFLMQLIPSFIVAISFKIILMAVLLIVIAQQQTFDPPIFFTAFLLLSNLYFFKVVLDLTVLKQASLALLSIQKFLLCAQVDRSHITHDRFKKAADGQIVLSIEGNYVWSKQNSAQTSQDQVKDANIKIKKGELVAVVGPYGSGKSSLIKAALGQLQARPNAKVCLSGSVAYVGQKPWIMNATVRQNILFSESFDLTKYQDAVKGACLQADFATLEQGDSTMMGERGCNLSGGQKLRISLARAIYSGADIFLFDDILSAVDAHIATFIFFTTLKQHLKGKTIFLVTHALTFLTHTDRIYIVEQGAVSASGTFKQLQNHKIFSQIKVAKPKNVDQSKKVAQVKEIQLSEQGEQQEQTKTDVQEANIYIKSNGGTSFIVVLISYVFFNIGVHTFLLLWMNNWSSSKDYHEAVYYLVYLMCSFLAGFIVIAFTYYLYSRPLYRDLPASIVESLLRSPLEFFMAAPSAKIIRVISSDLRVNDRVLGQCVLRLLLYFCAYMSNVFAIIAVAILMKNFFLLLNQIVFLPILAYICIKFLTAQRKYGGIQHDVKLPLNSSFDQTLDGLSVIRAHCKEDHQVNIFLQRLGIYCRYNTISKGLSTSNEFVTTFLYVIFYLICIILLSRSKDQIKFDCILLASIYRGEELLISAYGLCIEFMVNLKSLRKCEQLTKLQVQKGLQIIKINHQEDTEDFQCTSIAPTPFPFESKSIQFKGFSAKYRGRSSNVLHRVSFSIKQGQKVGVVGRTGSGKSTLILSLMRSIGCSQGQILVGGVDIQTIPLSQLRAGISVVLQEHFLFAGTVRQNVDPTNSHTGSEIEKALEKCGLWDTLSKRGGLSAEVAQQGSNLSAGEKQLLNLTRALLSPRGIVLMDEATANIDSATDQILLHTMKSSFENSTVLTVAHRITTVLDCDRILVMDAGKVAQFDSPKALLKNPDSLFRKLCDQTGVTVKQAHQIIDSPRKSRKNIKISEE